MQVDDADPARLQHLCTRQRMGAVVVENAHAIELPEAREQRPPAHLVTGLSTGGGGTTTPDPTTPPPSCYKGLIYRLGFGCCVEIAANLALLELVLGIKLKLCPAI